LESSGEERLSLLAKADPAIRIAVDELLAQANADEGPLDRPAWELADDPTDPHPARLAPGTRIGPYRVDSHIGAGGMGQVYRATDERLTRTVAIKFSDVQFSHRFEREAKAIAALNHPNICQIYDVGPNNVIPRSLRSLMQRDEPLPNSTLALPQP
jgi:eukaryotic-like serine/threonine-protein kinase